MARKTKRPKRLEGKLFKGNVFSGGFSVGDLIKSQRYSKDVKKPTALRVIKKGKNEYSQYYYKPTYPGEFTD